MNLELCCFGKRELKLCVERIQNNHVNSIYPHIPVFQVHYIQGLISNVLALSNVLLNTVSVFFGLFLLVV